MAFFVGQKVVCVDARNGGPDEAYGDGYSWGLRNGAVYTVSAIDDDILYLAEVEEGWFASRFRPVVEKKTDISIFTAMLNKAPKKVTEDA